MLIAPLALAAGVQEVTGIDIVGSVTGFVGGLFGGRPNWFADAAAGKLAPCSNPIDLTEGDGRAAVPQEFAGIRTINPQELYAALQSAPQGNPGQVGPGGPSDPTKGTVEGLRTALIYGHKELAPFLTSLPALANAAAYTAHGTYNCDVGNWSNRPAASHSAVIIGRYRQRLAAQQAQQSSASPIVPGSALGPQHIALGIGAALLLLRGL